MEDAPDNTPKWIEERVGRAEEKMEKEQLSVARMTDRIEGKVDRLSSRFDDLEGHLSQRIRANRNLIIGVGTTILLAIISLFIYALSKTNRVEDRVWENTQRIEQVAPESQRQPSAVQPAPQDTSQ